MKKFNILLPFPQWTAAGVNGNPGVCARDRVVKEHKPGLGHALIPGQLTVGGDALDHLRKSALAILIAVQVS